MRAVGRSAAGPGRRAAGWPARAVSASRLGGALGAGLRVRARGGDACRRPPWLRRVRRRRSPGAPLRAAPGRRGRRWRGWRRGLEARRRRRRRGRRRRRRRRAAGSGPRSATRSAAKPVGRGRPRRRSGPAEEAGGSRRAGREGAATHVHSLNRRAAVRFGRGPLRGKKKNVAATRLLRGAGSRARRRPSLEAGRSARRPRRYHPDVSSEPDAEDRFRELAEAYGALSRPGSRLLYDSFGYRARGPWVGSPAAEQAFAGLFELWSRARRRPRNGRERNGAVAVVELGFYEAARGARRTVRYRSVGACAACGGSGAANGARWETCEACGGDGRLVGETCAECDGNRELERDREACGGDGRPSATCAECDGNRELERDRGRGVRFLRRRRRRAELTAPTRSSSASRRSRALTLLRAPRHRALPSRWGSRPAALSWRTSLGLRQSRRARSRREQASAGRSAARG